MLKLDVRLHPSAVDCLPLTQREDGKWVLHSVVNETDLHFNPMESNCDSNTLVTGCKGLTASEDKDTGQEVPGID